LVTVEKVATFKDDNASVLKSGECASFFNILPDRALLEIKVRTALVVGLAGDFRIIVHLDSLPPTGNGAAAFNSTTLRKN